MHTIVITGGHHNSALVVARELITRGHKVVWIGHRQSSRGDKIDSAEYIEVNTAHIPFHDLKAAKLTADFRELARFPWGIANTLKILKNIRPSAILSFGGYLGGTVSLAGKILNIPIYLHEQTVTAGRANKLIGKLARKIYLTWEESTKYFDKSKVMVVGLPLRSGILSAQLKELFTRHKPTLLVMGGKQGAHVINGFIFKNLSELLISFNVVHQTGTSSVTGDYDRAVSLQNTLGSLSDCYIPRGYITEAEIGTYLASADFYLGRSGAHICYELGIIGLRGILVPLMSTHDSEQHKNAEILVRGGLGHILAQSILSYPNFIKGYASIKAMDAVPMSLPLHASTLLVDDLIKDLK